jgi:hypothetical protein
MSIQIKRFNWRVSEQVAAELAHARREVGCRSWDEFFPALLRKWYENSDSSSRNVESSATKLKELQQSIDRLPPQIKAIHGIVESQGETVESILHEKAQISELIRRFNALLSLALGIDLQILDQTGVSATPAIDSRRERLLRKIRSKEVKP